LIKGSLLARGVDSGQTGEFKSEKNGVLHLLGNYRGEHGVHGMQPLVSLDLYKSVVETHQTQYLSLLSPIKTTAGTRNQRK
jgi:hypothetical protein